MPESPNAIDIQDLHKSYGRQVVLRALDLTVHAGEALGLVGVNGAGKTTLIKSILNFCDIDSGSIKIFSTRHVETQARQRVAFLPERFVPPYYLKGREFLHYMEQLHGVSNDEQRQLEIFSLLDLDASALDKPVRQLSKGMAQKLGIAACLLSGQDLFIFDEPMSGLDPKARAMFKRQLQALKEEHRTLFFSTHLLADVAELCDRLAVLHAGAVRFVGTPGEMCDRYSVPDLESAYLACIAE